MGGQSTKSGPRRTGHEAWSTAIRNGFTGTGTVWKIIHIIMIFLFSNDQKAFFFSFFFITNLINCNNVSEFTPSSGYIYTHIYTHLYACIYTFIRIFTFIASGYIYIFCVGVMYSGECDVCDVTLSVYPHRASLKSMPGHGGNRTYDLGSTLSQVYIVKE